MKRSAVLLALALCLSACSGSSDSTADSAAGDETASTTTNTSADGDTTVSPSSAVTPTSSSTTAAQEADEPVLVEEPANYIGSLEPDCATVGRVAVGVESGTITSGGVDYKYQWTVPSSYTGEPIPVVLDFHGIGTSGPIQAGFSGWSAKAEAEGFLAVHPTGISVPGEDRASWELPQFESSIRDDIAMVVDLLDHVAANICIDPTRVYATGMSNGGFFTSEVVCDLSDRIAAAVSVAGVTHHESCEPNRAVPYLAFHGTADTTVPFDGGGESTLAGAEDAGEFFSQVMPDEFAEFATDFGCVESADVVITSAVTLTSWSGCEDDVEVGFYTIEGAGHTWPGSAVSAAIPSLGVTNTDIDATAISWDFFGRHSLSSE